MKTKDGRQARILGLHVILTDAIGTGAPAPGADGVVFPSALVAPVVAAGPPVIQYRRKGGTPEVRLREAAALRTVTQNAGIVLIINDDVALARDVAADGVHLGADDLPVPAARGLLGEQAIIGATVRDAAGRRCAERDGADYVGLGPIWATRTKRIPVEPIGLEHLGAIASQPGIPIVAIGGIHSPERAERVSLHGADGVAVVGAIASASAPKKVIVAMNAAIGRGRRIRGR